MRNTYNSNKQVIEAFRANDGKVGGQFQNMSLLLLHTTGAKSGKERVTPLLYTKDDNRYVIIASKGGAPNNPDWYHNLVANPEVTIEVGREQFKAKAALIEEPKRSELFNNMANKHPFYAEYAKKTSRTIPVITLTRLS